MDKKPPTSKVYGGQVFYTRKVPEKACEWSNQANYMVKL